MSITFPESIAAYFQADSTPLDYFHPRAVVVDDGCTHVGLAAISEWREQTTLEYAYHHQIVDAQPQGRTWLVTSLVSGSFPGSPIHLQYEFQLDNHQIVELKIS